MTILLLICLFVVLGCEPFSEVYFCEEIDRTGDSLKPVGLSNTFSLNETFIVALNINAPLKTNDIIITVYLQTTDGTYVFYERREEPVDPDWSKGTLSFYYSLPIAGTYKIAYTRPDGTKIGDGTVHIK